MAEERNTRLTSTTGDTANTGLARAPQSTDTTTDSDADATKAELQRRMEEARESITHTVAEIKDTVTTQYDTVRGSINEALDWREYVRKRPTSLSIAAGTVGFFVGYALAGVFRGNSTEDDQYEYSDYEYDQDDDTYSPTSTARAYRAQSMAGTSSSIDSASRDSQSTVRTYRDSASPSYNYNSDDDSDTESNGPGLFERFKGTPAYDKLTSEVSSIGTRVVDELSHTAQAVVLPMLLGKLKDAIGIDLSTQKQVAQRSNLEKQTTEAHASAVSSDEQ